MNSPSKSHKNHQDAPQTAPPSAGDSALDALIKGEPQPDATPTEAPAPPAQTSTGAAPPTLDAPPVVAELEAATRDLQMPSETDAPFRVVYWPLDEAELTPSQVALYAAEKADAPVETESVEDFFANAASVEDWMGDDEKATAKRFQDLIETLNAKLERPETYLIGERERTVAVVGKVEGGFAGVVTLVVET